MVLPVSVCPDAVPGVKVPIMPMMPDAASVLLKLLKIRFFRIACFVKIALCELKLMKQTALRLRRRAAATSTCEIVFLIVGCKPKYAIKNQKY